MLFASVTAAAHAAVHAAAQEPGTAFKIMVLLHLLFVIGGFGFLIFNAAHLTLARRAGSPGAFEVNRDLSRLAEIFVVGAFVFGIAAVGSSNKEFDFGDGWVIGAMVAWVIDMGILHGLIKPKQRKFVEAAAKAAQAGSKGSQGGPPPELAELNKLEKVISLGWGAFNVVFLAALYLMVFKPGS